MLILRSILFSFTVLFLAILATPLIVVVWLVFGVLSLVLSMVLSLISPILGILVVFVFAIASYSVVSSMICTRFALQAKGVSPRNSYGALFGNSIGYGLAEAMLQFLAYGVVGVLITILLGTSFQELFLTLQSGQDSAVMAMFDANIGSVSGAMLLGAILIAAVRALMLMPIAASSVGRDPGGHMHTPFWGTGKRFFPLLIIVLLSAAPFVFFGVIADEFAKLLGYAGGYEEMLQPAFRRTGAPWWDSVTNGQLIALAMAWLTYTWMLSIQAAAAALIYLDLEGGRARAPSPEALIPGVGAPSPVQQVDAAKLWRDRM